MWLEVGEGKKGGGWAMKPGGDRARDGAYSLRN